jgi:hypothetical protein
VGGSSTRTFCQGRPILVEHVSMSEVDLVHRVRVALRGAVAAAFQLVHTAREIGPPPEDRLSGLPALANYFPPLRPTWKRLLTERASCPAG